jgi:hypothetical protein
MVGAKAGAGETARRVGFASLSGNQIAFAGVSKVVGALGDFDGDGLMDYAFALSPAGAGEGELCVYYGSGAGAGGGSGFSGGNVYPPTGGKSGCGVFPVLGSSAPEFASIAATAFKAGELPGLIVEDSANNTLYVLSITGAGVGGGLPGLAVLSTIAIPAADGAGPIYTGDFNGDGETDFIVNGQSGQSASVYLGDGDGTFQTPVRYTFDHGVRLLRLADMDGDGRADMMVVGEGRVVEVFHGNGDGSFATTSEGGVVLPGGVVSGGLLAADVDKDGCGDIAALIGGGPADAGGASELYVWYGRCDGTFGEPQVVPLSRGYSLAALADVDGDGLPDFVLSDGAVVSVLYGLGKRSFSAEQQVYAGIGVTSLAVTDVDRDGAPDLVVTNGVAMIAGSGAAGVSAGAGTGGTRVLLNTAKSRAKPEATATTTTTLYLCVGPTVACPSAGYVMPPFSATLPMIYGQTYNGTVIATPSDGVALTGDILFYDDYDGVTTLLCTLVASTSSSCPPTVGTGAQVGTHVFTGVYVPGTVDTTHSESTSSPVTMTVSPDSTTAIGVGAPNPSPFGQPVTFTATLTGNYAAPTGAVGFVELFPPTTVVALLGTAVLVPGSSLSSTATFTVSTLTVGTDTIAVSYGGDLDFSGTVSPVFPETITPVVATTTTVTPSLNPSYFGQSVTFTATVADVGGVPTPVPTGTVMFLDSGTAIGTGTLNASGVATFTTSTLAVGSHNITASASGDGATGPSSSAVLVEVVDALPPAGTVDFTITATPNPVSVGVGEGAQLTVTATALNGFAFGVNLSCSGLPIEATCTFVYPSIPAGGGTTALLLGTTAPHSCGTTQPYFLGERGGGPGLGTLAVPALAGLVAVFVPGRRRWLRGLMAIALVAGAMQLSGCGNCTDLGTRPGTYTIQVIGASAGTSEVESQIVTVTVTI